MVHIRIKSAQVFEDAKFSAAATRTAKVSRASAGRVVSDSAGVRDDAATLDYVDGVAVNTSFASCKSPFSAVFVGSPVSALGERGQRSIF